MKLDRLNLLLGLLLGSALHAHSAFNLVPNGDFEDPAGPETDWFQVIEDQNSSIQFFTADGNPTAHVVIDHFTNAALLVANDNQVLSLASLGLNAGSTYTFSQDMQFTTEAVFGSPVLSFDLGGMKIEYYSGTNLIGSSGDLYPEELLDDGESWQTYSFDVNIPVTADGIKVVTLWGEGSTVSFDNIGYDDVALPPITEIPNGDFEVAAGDSWGINDDEGAAVITFPTAGGSGDNGGFASIDITNAGFGVLISHSDQALPLGGLGLTPGLAYNFTQDMKVLNGTEIGGLKVEFFSSGVQHSTTGNLFPVPTDAMNWDTYTFPILIPPHADAIKLVLLGGSNSEVGFDNVTFDATPVSNPALIDIPNGDFSEGRNNWGTGGEPSTTITFPNTGGNPGSYALMDNNGDAGSFGVLVGNADSSIPLEYLGLTGGNAYEFSMDTYRDSGTNVASLKVEFYNYGSFIGDTGNIAASSVTGSWTTDDFLVSVPANVDAIRVVPVAGISSAIRFDNISVDPTPFVAPLLPNLDFELGGASWTQFQSGVPISFPASGGNPDGHARMNDFGGAYGVLVANSNVIVPLADLGLTAGSDFDLKLDMKIFDAFDPSVANLGGIKIEFYSGATGGEATGDKINDLRPSALIGDGETWETYTFENLAIPETLLDNVSPVDGLKIILVWGVNADVGFDNVEVVIPDPPAAITITDCGTDGSGNFFIDVEEGVAGLRVTSSPDLSTAFSPVSGVTASGSNRFIIPAASLDGNADGADFFRVEEAP